MYNLKGKVAKIQPYALDKTLTVEGAAAEAEATGKAIENERVLREVHETSIDNPHKVTKAQVGLGQVDNTSDMDKPVSTLQAEAIADAKKAGTQAKTAADNAQTTADEANAAAGNAQTKADSAYALANTAKTKAEAAQTKAEAAQADFTANGAKLENGKVVASQACSAVKNIYATEYTLTESDVGKFLLTREPESGSSTTIYIPAGLPMGEIEIMRYHWGEVTITAGSGVSLRGAGAPTTNPVSVKIANRYGVVALKKVFSDNWWVITGDYA